MTPALLTITQYDLQPYYYAQAKDSDGVINLTGASIVCNLKNSLDNTIKINRQSAGINITDAVNGEFEYRWVSGDTDITGDYLIEFEVTPSSGGKFTLPQAPLRIIPGLDTT